VIKLVESPDLTTSDSSLWGCMKSEVYKTKADALDESLPRILDAAARIKKRGDQPRRTTRDLRTITAKAIEVDGGISENLM
jgi:hypothetical protein